MERPEIGFLSRVRLHETSRQNPVEEQYKRTTLMEAPSSVKAVPEAVESLKISGQLYKEDSKK